MARFCLVAPPQILEGLARKQQLGRSHLLLAHDIVANPAPYLKLFNPAHRTRQDFIILDNSVIELGFSVNLDMIVEAVKIVRPNCVVLPDMMHDTDGTIKSCTEALETWKDAFYKAHISEHISWMIVPQGKTLRDFARCAEAFVSSVYVYWWGVPRNLVKHFGTRREAIQVLQMLNPHRPIHMLGFSDDHIDDMLCARNLGIYSIDSAVPLRIPLDISLSTLPGSRGKWWDEGQMSDYVIPNIRRVRKWIGDVDAGT